MDEKHLKIELVWGSDKTIWTAKVEDVPGLEFEAESIDGLINALKETLPEITLLTRTSVDSITSKNDLRHMTDQELLCLTKKVVSELYTRQKYKSASIIQEAVQAKESNNVNRFHELCARVGESRATEEVLRQFLGRF
ncbi:MAG: DUF1902 domain-containing protein [Succiniclasticum sp.]|nr:DUF1902 domain-containing protein [Succiniclasticum sp.]